MKKKTTQEIESQLQQYKKKFPIYCILDNVRSMYNVGSIFRTSDATNIEKLILCGMTAKPPRKEIDKTALGAVENVNWEYFNQTQEAIESLRKEVKNIKIISVEQCHESISYEKISVDFPIALIFGHEVNGIQNDILKLSDYSVDIPMYGKKHSLNLAVSYGITIYSFIQKYLEKELYAEIVFNLPTEKAFTYKIPKDFHSDIKVGQRVICPFGKNKKEKLGYITNIKTDKPSFPCHDILKIEDKNIFIHNSTFKLAKWISDFYLCSLGRTLSLFIPKETEAKEYPYKNVLKKELHPLNKEQKDIIQQITPSIDQKKSEIFLIYGITGSGKTEIYKQLSQYVLNQGKKVIILVPEISLTPQMIEEFQSNFGNQLAIFHSRLNSKIRYHEWLKVYENKAQIILGARSALFSPQNDLGLIIIDEEHETSYKASDHPRYLARQIAYKMSQNLNIPLIMGTATPSIETYYAGINKSIHLLHMKERHSKFYEKSIHIVDMRKETSFISQILFKKIIEKLKKKEQVILFLNRRGYSNLLLCQSCGYYCICPNCDITLTYHQDLNVQVCHFCSYQRKKSQLCENCQSEKLLDIGYGTQKIEEEIQNLFLQARITRMDLDTTKKKGSHEKILKEFKQGKFDILIGTQMITKGLHFPNVTLVGVLMAELSLNLPDFRAEEKTFSLLTQVIGRTGRGENIGEIVIQTYIPKNPLFDFVKNEDYKGFFEYEIENRKKYHYPPFYQIIRLVIRGTDAKKIKDKIKSIEKQFKTDYYDFLKQEKIELLGPSECFFKKINKNYRQQIIFKVKSIESESIQAIRNFLKNIQTYSKNEFIEIDFSPLQLL